MTGPEHFRAAERLAESVTKRDALSGARILQPGSHSDVIALAEVHAVLALTAAYAADAIYRRDDRTEWDAATGHASTEQEITR